MKDDADSPLEGKLFWQLPRPLNYQGKFGERSQSCHQANGFGQPKDSQSLIYGPAPFDSTRPSLSLISYEQMLVECDLLLATQPEQYETWYNRGDALANLGDCEAALISFNHALRLHPNRVEALVFQAVMLIRLERYEEALTSCDRALLFAPEHSEAWLFRGVALSYQGRYREAYASYDRSLGKKKISLGQWVSQKLEKISRIWRTGF